MDYLPVCPFALKGCIRPVAKEINIDLGGWHAFRYTVATSMLRAGHGGKVVSELLGHSDVSPTLRTDAFEPGGKPVVMKLLRNGFRHEIDLFKRLALKKDGERGRNRTYNLLIKSQSLVRRYSQAMSFINQSLPAIKARTSAHG